MPEAELSRTGTTAPDEERVSLVRFGSVILRHRRAIVRLSILFAIVAVIVTLLRPDTYTSNASFIPQAESTNVSQLSGLASSLGFSLPGASAAESPEFYVSLLSSRDLLDSTVEHTYAVPDPDGGPARTGTLIDFYGIDGPTRPEELLEARKRLSEEMRAAIQSDVGVVQIFVRARWPELAQQILARVIERVNDFNLRARQSKARAERRFVEGRLEQSQRELREAEAAMADFLESNRRGYETSPELKFEYGRLQRQVELRETIHRTLADSYERSRIDEVRNTPVITIVDTPALPPRPDRRNVLLKVLLAALIGLVVAVVYAVTAEFVRGARDQDPDDFLEFEQLREEAVGDIRSLLSRIRNRGGQSRESA